MSAGAAAGAASARASGKAGKKPQAKRSAAPAKGSTTSGVSAARGRSRSQDAAAAKAAVAKNNAAKEAAKKVSGTTRIPFCHNLPFVVTLTGMARLGPCRLLTRSDGCQFVGGDRHVRRRRCCATWTLACYWTTPTGYVNSGPSSRPAYVKQGVAQTTLQVMVHSLVTILSVCLDFLTITSMCTNR
jgi:hypothetical protein